MACVVLKVDSNPKYLDRVLQQLILDIFIFWGCTGFWCYAAYCSCIFQGVKGAANGAGTISLADSTLACYLQIL